MKKIKWIILLMIILSLIFSIYFIFFNTKTSKILKNGNNMSSQEIVDYFLNISCKINKDMIQMNQNVRVGRITGWQSVRS